MTSVRTAVFAGGVASIISLACTANAQVANYLTDSGEYERLALAPNNTLVGYTYFRWYSSADPPSFSEASAAFRALYILRFGNLAFIPADVLVPAADLTVYAAVPGSPGTVTPLHTSGLGDGFYESTLAYTIPEGGAPKTHTVLAATPIVTPPWGNYDAASPVNIGDNRWRFQGNINVSQRLFEILAFSAVGDATFCTANTDVALRTGTGRRTQAPTFGFEGHAILDLAPTFYVATSYYLTAVGQRTVWLGDVPAPAGGRPEQTTQALRFTFGMSPAKASLLLLQYDQDVATSGGAPIVRFFGVRFSQAVVF
jgi:hypothetical protein